MEDKKKSPLVSSKKIRFIFWYALIGIALGIAVSYSTFHQLQSTLELRMSRDAARLSEKISDELSRYSQLPTILSHDPRLINSLINDSGSQNNQVLNLLLEEWAKQSSADTIYLLKVTGLAVASSNWQEKDSFVGSNYAFRPYFKQAMMNTPGRYFALGSKSEERGYYFSSPIRFNNSIIGVLTVKVNLENIDRLWSYESLDFSLIDDKSVIFYSSKPNWLYNTLVPLSQAEKVSILRSSQYGQAPLFALSNIQSLQQLKESDRLSILKTPFTEEQTLFITKRQIKDTGIKILAMSDIQHTYQSVQRVLLIFIVFYTLLVLVVTSWYQTLMARRKLTAANDELEHKVIKRTLSLQQSNQTLRDTIQQYEITQKELQQTQSELTQAAKLAMLGELSAGINHEINQPLSAIRTYAENCQRLLHKQQYDVVSSNIEKIVELNIVISEIIAKFKVFARKSSTNASYHTDIKTAITSALTIIGNKLINQGITLKIEPNNLETTVHAELIQFEQVLVNLIHNSIQALEGIESPQIVFSVEIDSEHALICLTDNGKGMSQQQLHDIFTPFFTTKKEGLGLGMTISKRIIESFSGQLTAGNHQPRGAKFTIALPLFHDNKGQK